MIHNRKCPLSLWKLANRKESSSQFQFNSLYLVTKENFYNFKISIIVTS